MESLQNIKKKLLNFFFLAKHFTFFYINMGLNYIYVLKVSPQKDGNFNGFVNL